ncbi:MAG: copper chaperone PCu(A)C [Dokdonella sp.]
MNIVKSSFSFISVLMSLATFPAVAAGKLEISEAWIRSAPPNATMLAGYATLYNAGDAPITINAVNAAGFEDTSLHETVLVGDVSQMRAIGDLIIAPGASVVFAPAGKHIMLMKPTQAPTPGTAVAITFNFANGGNQSAQFVIRDAAPGEQTAMPVTHDH